MDKFYNKRRTIIGTQQVPEGHELVDTVTYAKRFHLHLRTVRRMCTRKQLTSYKSAGKWYILVPKTNSD